MPRLIQLADFRRPEAGSFIPLLRATSAAALERGWTSEVAFFDEVAGHDWLTPFRSSGTQVHLAPASMRRSDRRLRTWLRAIVPSSGEPTVLHTHFTGFDVAAALVARRDPAIRLVWHIHSTLPGDPLRRARASLKVGVLGRGVDAFVCPAQNIVDGVIARGAPRSRVQLLPTAIDPTLFSIAGPGERAIAREALGLPLDRTLLLHFGWHWHLKGGDIFLRVVRELVDRGRDVVGVERGGEEGQYRELARRLAVDDRLVVTDPVHDVGQLHATADVTVASSRREGMAYTVLEALATGTPVVATDIPGHAFIAERAPACHTTSHDPADIAAAVIEALDQPESVVRGEALTTRRWIESNLSVDAVAAGIVGAYESLLAGEEPRWWTPGPAAPALYEAT